MQNNSMSHDNLNLSSRKRSRLQIRLESLCIKRKVKKIRVKDSVRIGAIRELFLTFVLWPQTHRTNYCKAYLYSYSKNIYYRKVNWG